MLDLQMQKLFKEMAEHLMKRSKNASIYESNLEKALKDLDK